MWYFIPCSRAAFSGGSHADLRATNGALDSSKELTVSAWVRVERGAESIQTIVSNKASGCGADREHFGFALCAA